MQRDQQGRLSWAIVLLIIAVSCAVAFVAARLWTGLGGGSTFADYKAVQLDSAQEIQAVDDGFVYYDGSSITKVSAEGKTQWSTMVGTGAGFEATDKGVAAWIGPKLSLVNDETGVTEYSGNMDADVLSAHIGAQYTAVLTGPEHNSTIVLMETGGRRVDSITLADQTVIDYGFFYNDTLFWVMALDTNGTAPSCTVNTYRPGRRMVGSVSDSEQLIYGSICQSTEICVVGDTNVKFFTYNGEEDKSKRELVYGWTLQDSDISGDIPTLAFALNTQCDATTVMRDVLMLRGGDRQTVRMPFGCTKLEVTGDKVYGFSPEGYVMVAKMGRQKVNAYQLPMYFDKVYGVANGKVAMLGSGNNVYLVPLE